MHLGCIRQGVLTSSLLTQSKAFHRLVQIQHFYILVKTSPPFLPTTHSLKSPPSLSGNHFEPLRHSECVYVSLEGMKTSHLLRLNTKIETGGRIQHSCNEISSCTLLTYSKQQNVNYSKDNYS